MPIKLGATGDYPLGKLSDDDEGGLRVGLTIMDNKMVIAFGKSVSWVALDKATALELADTIKRRAEELT